jgi:hypothetical protein
MPRKIFGPKWDEVTGEWKRLHNYIVLTKYFSGDQIKTKQMGETCSTHVSGGYRGLARKPDGRLDGGHLEDLCVDIYTYIYIYIETHTYRSPS